MKSIASSFSLFFVAAATAFVCVIGTPEVSFATVADSIDPLEMTPEEPPDQGIELLSIAGGFSNPYSQGSYYKALRNTKMSGLARTDIVAVAQSQVGYHEGNSENDIDGDSEGANNYTEYGRYFGKQGEQWCAYFVSWCARQAGVSPKVLANSGLSSPTSFEAPSYHWSQTSFASGSYTPRAGDLVLMAWSGSSSSSTTLSHTAMIKNVNKKGTDVDVTVIHGNYSDAVSETTFTVDADTGYFDGGAMVYVVAPNYEGAPTSQASLRTLPAIDDKPLTFLDVLSNAWYSDAVRYVANIGIMNGYNDGTFGVGNELTRAECAMLLYRIAESEEAHENESDLTFNTTPLKDVKNRQWYTRAINWAYDKGYMTGYQKGSSASVFGVNDPVSFEQFVTILGRYLVGQDNLEALDQEILAYYLDARSISSFARPALSWAISKGIVQGNGRWLYPDESLVRERAATVLMRLSKDGYL